MKGISDFLAKFKVIPNPKDEKRIIASIVSDIISQEVTEDSIKQPEKTIFCFLPSDVGDNDRSIRFTKEAYKSLEAIAELVKRNGATVLPNLLQVAGYLNSKK